MNVSESIISHLNGFIFSYSEKIVEKYNNVIKLEDILQIWCDQQQVSFERVFLQMIKLSKKTKKDKPEKDTVIKEDFIEDKTNDTPISNNDDENVGTSCSYKFTRGVKKGTRCTVIAKTGPLCSKHKVKN